MGGVPHRAALHHHHRGPHLRQVQLLNKTIEIFTDVCCKQVQREADLPRVRAPGRQCAHAGRRLHLYVVTSSAANRLIGEVVQSRRRPLIGHSHS